MTPPLPSLPPARTAEPTAIRGTVNAPWRPLPRPVALAVGLPHHRSWNALTAIITLPAIILVNYWLVKLAGAGNTALTSAAGLGAAL